MPILLNLSMFKRSFILKRFPWNYCGKIMKKTALAYPMGNSLFDFDNICNLLRWQTHDRHCQLTVPNTTVKRSKPRLSSHQSHLNVFWKNVSWAWQQFFCYDISTADLSYPVMNCYALILIHQRPRVKEVFGPFFTILHT